VTSISISYAGGYTVRHGKQDAGLSATTLQLAAGERIIHVQVCQCDDTWGASSPAAAMDLAGAVHLMCRGWK
jgi:hypothetical protein